MPKPLIFILFLLAISSCSSTTGNKATIKLYKAELTKGQEISDIVRNYGNYSNFWKDENGNEVYQYYYSKSGYDLVSQLPIINHFGFIKSENYEVLLVVDNKDLLLEKINFYNRAKSSNSLVCNQQIYSCLRKVY